MIDTTAMRSGTIAPLRLFLRSVQRRRGARLPGAAVPDRPDDALRLVTLNLAHGRGPRQTHVRRPRLENNLLGVAHALRDLVPDVVALQEADGPSTWSGNFDHVAKLSDLTQLSNHFRGDHNPFGSRRLKLASGTALLARHYLRSLRSHRFADNWRDTKGVVLATIEVPQWSGRALDVASVHLDFLTKSVRQRQIGTLARLLGRRRHPLVVLGDLNCCYHREPESLELLGRALGVRAFDPHSHSPTYPARRPRRRLDWILISEELDFGGYGTLPVWCSDHLPVAADLVLRDAS